MSQRVHVDAEIGNALADEAGAALVRNALDAMPLERPDEDALFALGVAIGATRPALVDEVVAWTEAAPERAPVVRWVLEGALRFAPPAHQPRVRAAMKRLACE